MYDAAGVQSLPYQRYLLQGDTDAERCDTLMVPIFQKKSPPGDEGAFPLFAQSPLCCGRQIQVCTIVLLIHPWQSSPMRSDAIHTEEERSPVAVRFKGHGRSFVGPASAYLGRQFGRQVRSRQQIHDVRFSEGCPAKCSHQSLAPAAPRLDQGPDETCIDPRPYFKVFHLPSHARYFKGDPRCAVEKHPTFKPGDSNSFHSVCTGKDVFALFQRFDLKFQESLSLGFDSLTKFKLWCCKRFASWLLNADQTQL